MKHTRTLLAILSLLPSCLFATDRALPEVPTRAEADTLIESEMAARELQELGRKASIEAVPALAEWEVDQGRHKTIFRRVAPPSPGITTLRQTKSSDVDRIRASQWSEAQIAAWMAEQPVSRMLNLTATVYDHSMSHIEWRDHETGEVWIVVSNVDFSYLNHIGGFVDEQHAWTTFLFVEEVEVEKELETVRLAAEKGFDYIPRSAERWLAMLPSDFLSSQDSEYIVFAEDETVPIPAALYEELDALHQYYQANEKRLIAEYKRNIVLNEARRAWCAANPPEPQNTVINFWRVR